MGLFDALGKTIGLGITVAKDVTGVSMLEAMIDDDEKPIQSLDQLKKVLKSLNDED